MNHTSVIYSEVVYRHRTYYVKNDNKIYTSHLAGSGKPLLDSFAFDESVDYGYIENLQVDYNMALGITALDELIIWNAKGISILREERGGVKRLINLSNGCGIYSTKSLTRDIKGKPQGNGFFWFGDNGVFYYEGGIKPPINITTNYLNNYLTNISEFDRIDAVGIFDRYKYEYWLSFGDKILIFELLYKQFRTLDYYSFDYYVGEYKSKIYVIPSSMNVLIPLQNYVIGNNPMGGTIETHYTAGMYLDRYGRALNAEVSDDKLLQELFFSFGDCTVNSYIDINIIVDDVQIAETIRVNAVSNKTVFTLAPYGIKFQKAKLKITIPRQYKVTINAFGFTSSIARKEIGAEGLDYALSGGYGTGYGTDYGNNL